MSSSEDSQTFPAPAESSGAPSGRRWRRYGKWVAGLFATFGIFGAVGSFVVSEILPDAAEKVVGGDPLRVSVREDPQGGGDGFTAAARSAAGLDDKLNQAKSCDSLFQTAKSAGAVDVTQSIHHLLLEGGTRRDAVIVDMRARILKRERPLSGARIHCQSAGAIEAIGVAFSLDEPTPVARELKPFAEPGEPYFRHGNVISLTKSEIQPIEVVAQVGGDYVEWEIEADVIIDGSKKTITINDHGQPFRLTGSRPMSDYQRHYEYVWYEQPPYLYAADREKAVDSTQSSPPSGGGRSEGLPGRTHCGGRVYAGPSTTCAFARKVRDEYRADGGRSLEVYSPVTKRTYTITCTGASTTVYTGGNNATVYIR